jgi:hypothetical protein
LHKTYLNLIKLFIYGAAILSILSATQLILDNSLTAFLLYEPPIGYAIFLITWYLIQPLILGALNIVMRHKLYQSDGWSVGLWLNGFFLMLVFSSITLVLSTVAGIAFTPTVAVAEILLLAIPIGLLAKFSNT